MFYMEEKCWDKLQQWAQLAYDEDKNEISGMLILEKDEDGDWQLKDPDILKQKNSATLTVLDKDAVRDWALKQATKYGTDSDWSVSLLINLREEYKLKLAIWHPIEQLQDVKLSILKEKKCATKAMKKKYKELCSDKVSTSSMKNIYNRHTNGWGQRVLDPMEAKHFDLLIDSIDSEFQQILNGMLVPAIAILSFS